MLPVIIFVVIAIPLLIAAFVIVRRKEKAAEVTDIDQAELEREFAAADAYEEKLREAQHGHSHDNHS